ncbi:MAG: fused MFS/spermidine synthase [Deltaproteobacteria bacterium]|nr:fused MFS/spermidine synthase [Deltaproteobacteria bacterium]
MHPTAVPHSRESALWGLLPLFLLSGATSLVYETLWGRELHLVFGTSQVAIATVLAAFMGGLSLGGFLMSRLADRIRRPVRVYGLLEGGIGLYALAFPVLLKSIVPFYLGFWRWLEPSPTVFSAFQALLAGLLLLVPTTCMGATLPLLARFATTRLSLAGHRVGLLYGVNTAGAVLGTFLAGFVLLPYLGLDATTSIAAAGNLVLFAGALLLSWRTEQGTALEVEADAVDSGAPADRSVLLVAGLAGFASLAYELAWFRLLTLTFGGSAYAFSTMLLAFLVGIAAGGWAGGPLADRTVTRAGRAGGLALLAGLQVGVAALSAATMWSWGQLPYVYVDLYTAVENAPIMFWPAQCLLAVVLMAPAALLMGATFPLAVRTFVGDPDRLGGPVGQVYAVNTVGGILGSVAAAFLLLPHLQVTGSVLAAGGVNLAGALVALAASWRARTRPTGAVRRRTALAGIGIVALGALALLKPPPWDPLLMTSGMYKYVADISIRTREHIYQYAVAPYDLLYYAEGLSSVVTVARNRKTGNVWLANNGKVDASSTSDMPTQILVGHLPLLLRPDARRACVVGLASGVTLGAVTRHPDLVSIEMVELEPAVFTASRFFDHVNHRPLEDPRVRPVVNDARNHVFLAKPGAWDAVISEPSNPWLTGVSNLFTREFFSAGRERLTPGGVWSQWIQVYGMGIEELRSLLATMRAVFPHVAVFATIEDADLVILGSDAPLVLDPDRVQAILAERPGVAEDLENIGIHDAWDLLTFHQMDESTLDAFVQGATLNTDDNMLVEFAAPRRLYRDTSVDNYRVLLHEARPPFHALEDLADHVALARAYARRERWVFALIVLKEAWERWPGNVEVEWLYNEYQHQFLVDRPSDPGGSGEASKPSAPPGGARREKPDD